MKASREFFERRVSKDEASNLCGLEYNVSTAGPDGCHVVIFTLPDTDKDLLQKAKDEARHRFDVVHLSVQQIDPQWLEDEAFTPGEPIGWISGARWIVEHGQARRLDPGTGELIPAKKRGGMLLDHYSASVMVRIYDALNPEHQKKFVAMSLPVAHDMAFKLLKKCRVAS